MSSEQLEILLESHMQVYAAMRYRTGFVVAAGVPHAACTEIALRQWWTSRFRYL